MVNAHSIVNPDKNIERNKKRPVIDLSFFISLGGWGGA